MDFLFDEGQSAELVVERLALQNWWGTIIGPHGSGKSTLLTALRPVLLAAGCCVHATALRDGQRRLPRSFLNELGAQKTMSTAAARDCRRALVVIDGYEQLGRLDRLRLKWFCRRTGAGLLITSHARCGVPALIRLSPDRSLIERVVARLCQGVSTAITTADIAASYASHGSNVREIFFELFDRHERHRRESGITDVAASGNRSRTFG
jgi:hypothetical protein